MYIYIRKQNVLINRFNIHTIVDINDQKVHSPIYFRS